MFRCVRVCLFGMIAMLLVMTPNGAANAAQQYHIPDDCLGSWNYCQSFRLKHFTYYGPYFTDDRRFLPDTTAPNLDDPFPSQIQPLSPSSGDPSESLRQ
jgi:hypothetical protein